MTKKIVYLILILTLSAFGQFGSHLNLGSRQEALGGAFTGIADDGEAVFYNQAGLVNLHNFELLAMYSRELAFLSYGAGADASINLNYYGYAQDFGDIGGAFSFRWFNRRFKQADYFDASENLFLFGYGRKFNFIANNQFLNNFSLGVGLKIMKAGFYDNSGLEYFLDNSSIWKWTYGIDLSSLYIYKRFGLGFVLNNVVKPDFSVIDEKSSLSDLDYRFGLSWKYGELLKNFIDIDFISKEESHFINLGNENVFSLVERNVFKNVLSDNFYLKEFSVRAGTSIELDSEYSTYKLTTGFGLKSTVGINLDYSFKLFLGDIYDYPSNHSWTLSYTKPSINLMDYKKFDYLKVEDLYDPNIFDDYNESKYLSNNYYYSKNLEFAKNLNEKEQFLIQLFRSIENYFDKGLTSEKKRVKTLLDKDYLLTAIKKYDDKENNSKNDDFLEIFNNLKKNELSSYYAKLFEANRIRRIIFETSDKIQKLNSFNYDLDKALREFAKGNYPLARLLLINIFNLYEYENLDDVLYYLALSNIETNHIADAKKILRQILDIFDESPYQLKSLENLILLLYQENEYSSIINYFKKYKSLISKSKNSDQIKYIAGICFYLSGKYEEAITTFSEISVVNDIHFRGDYFKANAYIFIDNFDKAEQIFDNLIEEYKSNILSNDWIHLKNNDMNNLLFNDLTIKSAHLKYLKFSIENKHNNKISKDIINQILKNFDFVDKNSPNYEEALMNKALIAHKFKQFDKSDEYLKILLDNESSSSFSIEAKTLNHYNDNYSSKTNKEDYNFLFNTFDELAKREKLKEEFDKRLNSFRTVEDIKNNLLENTATDLEYLKSYILNKDVIRELYYDDNNEIYSKTMLDTDKKLSRDFEINLLTQSITNISSEIRKLQQSLFELDDIKNHFLSKGSIKEIIAESRNREVVENLQNTLNNLRITSINKKNNLDLKRTTVDNWANIEYLNLSFGNFGFDEIEKLDAEIKKSEKILFDLEMQLDK